MLWLSKDVKLSIFRPLGWRTHWDVQCFSLLLFWMISVSLVLVSVGGFWRPHLQTEWTHSAICCDLETEGLTGLCRHLSRLRTASICTAW